MKKMRFKILLPVLMFVALQIFFVGTIRAENKNATEKVAAIPSQEQSPVAAGGAQSESEIPLFKDKTDKTVAQKSSASQMFMSILVVMTLVGVSFVLIRKYSYKNKTTKSQPKIKVLTQHHLGPKKSLAIIHVAGESILIGITDHNVNLIKSLSLIDDEVPQDLTQNFDRSIEEEAREQFSFATRKKSEKSLFAKKLNEEMESL